MNALTQLAADLGRAARAMPDAADAAVKAEAQRIEMAARAIDGTPETVVATFPGQGIAHLGGMSPDGIASGEPAAALRDTDMGETASSLADRLLTDGVNLVTGDSA